MYGAQARNWGEFSPVLSPEGEGTNEWSRVTVPRSCRMTRVDQSEPRNGQVTSGGLAGRFLPIGVAGGPQAEEHRPCSDLPPRRRLMAEN